jgi:hypothetical protein
MIPLYVVDIARQHRASHPGHRGVSPGRLVTIAAVVVASCTIAAMAAALILR